MIVISFWHVCEPNRSVQTDLTNRYIVYEVACVCGGSSYCKYDLASVYWESQNVIHVIPAKDCRFVIDTFTTRVSPTRDIFYVFDYMANLYSRRI